MNQLKAGVFLNYVAIGLNIVIGLTYTPYMLRMLGQSEYGLYSLAASIIAYLTVLDLGFGNAIVRYTAKFRAENKVREQQEMFGMFLILYICIGAIAFMAGSLLALNVENLFSAKMTATEVERTRIILWLMTFNLSITFPMSIWGSIMTAYEKFVFQKSVTIARSILNPLTMVVLLAYGYKAIAMVIVTTIFNVLTLCINHLYCKIHLHIKIKFGTFNWAFLKEVSVYSFWIFLNVIMDRIYWSTGQFVLGVFAGTVAIAVYSLAIHLHGFYSMFSTAISGVFLPRVTSMITKGSSDKNVSDLFIRTGRLQYCIMAFILSAFIVFGKSFIQMWAGPGYEEAYIISLLFFIPLTVPSIQNLGIVILQARNQMKFRSILYIIIALASLGVSIPLAKLYGGIGCAIGTSAALTVGQIIIMNIYYKRKQGIDIPSFWKEIAKMTVIPSFVTLATIYLILQFDINLNSHLSFIGCSAIFTIAYVFLFWRFSMNESERELFLTPLKKLRLYEKA